MINILEDINFYRQNFLNFFNTYFRIFKMEINFLRVDIFWIFCNFTDFFGIIIALLRIFKVKRTF